MNVEVGDLVNWMEMHTIDFKTTAVIQNIGVVVKIEHSFNFKYEVFWLNITGIRDYFYGVESLYEDELFKNKREFMDSGDSCGTVFAPH